MLEGHRGEKIQPCVDDVTSINLPGADMCVPARVCSCVMDMHGKRLHSLTGQGEVPDTETERGPGPDRPLNPAPDLTFGQEQGHVPPALGSISDTSSQAGRRYLGRRMGSGDCRVSCVWPCGIRDWGQHRVTMGSMSPTPPAQPTSSATFHSPRADGSGLMRIFPGWAGGLSRQWPCVQGRDHTRGDEVCP